MELAVRVIGKRRDRGNQTSNRPLGSVIVGKRDRQIKAKWVEILGYMADPASRGVIGSQFQYLATCHSTWIQSYRDIWESLKDVVERGSPTPAEWDAAIDTAWTNLMRDGRVPGAFPLDRRGDVDVLTTWVWSDHERRSTLVIKLDEVAMLREMKEQILKEHDYVDQSRNVSGPRFMFDWENDLGMGARTLGEIRDPTFVFNPRINIRVDSNLKQEITRIA